jgi:hypothetical protein
VARFRSALKRLAQSPEETRSEGLRHWVSTIPDAVRIADVQPRKHQRVAGVVQNIRIDPREGSGYVEATLIDGSGEMIVRWLGRRTMSGIRLGMGVIAEGIAGKTPQNELMLLNPEYQLVPNPEHE